MMYRKTGLELLPLIESWKSLSGQIGLSLVTTLSMRRKAIMIRCSCAILRP